MRLGGPTGGAPRLGGPPLECVEVNEDEFLPIDWVYMSPPWGGEGYAGHRDFLRDRYFVSDKKDIFQLVLAAAR